jgi:hypothetical protein
LSLVLLDASLVASSVMYKVGVLLSWRLFNLSMPVPPCPMLVAFRWRERLLKTPADAHSHNYLHGTD